MSIFDRTVTENGDIDPGYLGMLAVLWIVLGAIPAALILAGIHLAIGKDHPLDLVGVAAVISAAGIAFGSAALGVAAFRRSGQPAPPAPPPPSAAAIGNVAAAAASAAQPAEAVLVDSGRSVERCGRKRGKRAR